MRITKNTLQLTPNGLRFHWFAQPVIDFSATEALELAHQILQRQDELLEMIRQTDKRKQQQKDERHIYEHPIPDGPHPD